ncbi:unknown [Feldmannia species virus]|uniref:Uncharacterized protein n=1 Tax=Feldmannia species virus TaxID=39420 RepID=B5LWM3_9PHYC|nr:hypothetical protein FeldSpV_gp134 [Feldmannia species virus]ACH46886.1 unknown [Feldmannia species virus]
MNTIVDNVVNATIRIDNATQKGSVIDVIRMVLRCDASSANTAFRRLKDDMLKSRAEFGAACSHLRINGKGRLTPVANAKTLVEIIFSLPGKLAREFRRKSASQICRLLGGDPTLVFEIEQRRAELESTPKGRVTQAFLLGESRHDTDDDFTGMPVGFRYLEESQRRAVAGEVVALALKRQRIEDMIGSYASLRSLGVELDPRTMVEIRDNVSLLTKRKLSIEEREDSTTRLVDPKTPTHVLGREERGNESGIVVVASKMGVRVPPSMSGPIGKLMKILYKKKYDLPNDWNDFVKRQTLYLGRPVMENCYYERDEDIITEAIKLKLNL